MHQVQAHNTDRLGVIAARTAVTLVVCALLASCTSKLAVQQSPPVAVSREEQLPGDFLFAEGSRHEAEGAWQKAIESYERVLTAYGETIKQVEDRLEQHYESDIFEGMTIPESQAFTGRLERRRRYCRIQITKVSIPLQRAKGALYRSQHPDQYPLPR